MTDQPRNASRPIPVAVYARKSKGQEPDAQLGRLVRAVEAEGLFLHTSATDVASGKNPNRPGWQRIMAAVDGGQVRQVWITKVDRAMRSSKHYLDVVERLQKRGCHLRVLDQPMLNVLDKDDPMSKAFRTIGAAFAQLEVDLAAERSNEGHEVRPDGVMVGPSGAPVGRPREFGVGHKMRQRGGKFVHDRPRCKVCRGETGGLSVSPSDPPTDRGVAEPNGLTTPTRNENQTSTIAGLVEKVAEPPLTEEVGLQGGGA